MLLHDHLDGGLRPTTVIDLAAEHGYDALPTTDAAELARWFTEGANRRDLVLYLETFAHTVGVMQHADAIERVVGRVRRGPRRRRRRLRRGAHGPGAAASRPGLTLDEAIEAMLARLPRRRRPARHRRSA